MKTLQWTTKKLTCLWGLSKTKQTTFQLISHEMKLKWKDEVHDIWTIQYIQYMAFLQCIYNLLHPLLMHIKTLAHTNLSQLDFEIFWWKCVWCLCKTNLHDARCCGWLLGHCYYVFAKTFCLVVSELPQCGLSRSVDWFCYIGKAASVECPTFHNSSFFTFYLLTSSQEHTSLSLIPFIWLSSLNSSIMQSIRFIRDFTRLVLDVGDNSWMPTQNTLH